VKVDAQLFSLMMERVEEAVGATVTENG